MRRQCVHPAAIGCLKDGLETRGYSAEASILERADFEHLEAQGRLHRLSCGSAAHLWHYPPLGLTLIEVQKYARRPEQLAVHSRRTPTLAPAACALPMPRLVIVEPDYASTVGHHGEVSLPLLEVLGKGFGDWCARQLGSYAVFA